MNTFQLKCFLAVAETLNFAKASRRLNTTQPTITHQIKSLEDELNTKLFNRSTRVVELTADGIAFVDDAKSMISIEERAKLRFSIPNEESIESIAIGCVDNLQAELLENVLRKLNHSVKNFYPRIIVNSRSHLFHLIDSDQIDVVFDLKYEKEDFGKYKFLELADSRLVGFCKEEYSFSSIESLPADGNLDIPIVFCSNATDNQSEFSRLQLSLFQNHNMRNVHFVPSPEISKTFARAGIGVSILQSIYFQTLDEGMKKINIEPMLNFKFGAIYKTPVEKPLLKTFLNAVKEDFFKI